MHGEQRPGFSLLDVPSTMWRQKWKTGLVFLGCLTATLLIALFWPRTYRSEARLFMKIGRESVSLDPTVTRGQMLALNESREIEINSCTEILQSRALAERVVETLGAEEVLNEGATGKEGAGAPGLRDVVTWVRSINGAPPVSSQERAATSLAKALKVWAARKSSVICLQYDAESPALAQTVLDAVLQEYQLEHVRVNRTHGSYNFLVDQVALLEANLQQAQNAVLQAKNEAKLASIEGKRQTIEETLRQIDLQMLSTTTELAAAEAKVSGLAEAIAVLPERLVTQDVQGHPNDAADRMREALYKLELRESELASNYTDDHPLILAVRTQVKQAKAILEAQDRDRTQTTKGVHPSRMQLDLTRVGEEASLSSLRARAKSLLEQHELALENSKRWNAHEMQIVDLQRQAAFAESSYRNYVEKLEQARFDQQLETEKISNINIVQPATYVAKAASPNQLLVVVLGLIISSLGSLGVALLADARRATGRLARTPRLDLNPADPPRPAPLRPRELAGSHRSSAK